MKRRASLGLVTGTLVLVAAIVFLVWLSIPDVVRLAERVDDAEAETTVPGASFAEFDDERVLSRVVNVNEIARPALTPPFPSKLSFELELPEDPFLELSPALVMERSVGRARVEFVVAVEADGEATTVYRKLVDLRDANLWHDETIDLRPWSGRRVRLTFETRGDPHRGNILWAGRVQTAWGSPRVVQRPLARERATIAEDLSQAMDWLRREAVRVGIDAEERETLGGFAVNLLVAGLLSVVVSELLRRSHHRPGGRRDLANALPLITLVMTVVIAVVHLSVPLSLGLLGALSLIRFRTPVRSGEELLYILIAVALGLTLGAGQRLIAVAATVVIAVLLWMVKLRVAPPSERRLLLSASGSGDGSLTQLEKALDALGDDTVIQEFATRGEEVTVRALVIVRRREEAKRLAEAIWTRLPTFRVSLRDADGPAP